MPPSRSDGVGVKAGRKPGSVLPSSGRGVIIYLGPSSPAASSGSQSRNVEDGQPFVPGPCSQPGFTEPAPLDAAGALLPHLCTLACAKGEFPQGHRRCVSVALSSRSPALGVTQQAWPSGSPDFPQPILERIDRNHLACFQSSSCLAGIIKPPG